MELVALLFIFAWYACTEVFVDGQTPLPAFRPRNTAALNNTQVTLKCVFSTTTNYATWREYITGTGTGQVSISGGANINPSHPRAGRYSLDANEPVGQYNLQIKALAPDDSGYYACSGDQLENAKYGAYVVYLAPMACDVTQGGTAVTNNILVENENFTLTCQRDYRSFPGWPPVLEWTGPTPISITRNITTTTNIRYKVDLQATDSMNENIYRCSTTFMSPPPFKSVDEGFQDDISIPNITETDCKVKIQVHWGAKNIIISPDKPEYFVGEQIICTASANPHPITYHWIRVDCGSAPDVVRSQNLTILSDMKGSSCIYACNASNWVKGQYISNNYTLIFTVSDKKSQPLSTQPLSTGAIVGITIAVAVLVCILISLLVYYLVLKKKKRVCEKEKRQTVTASNSNEK